MYGPQKETESDIPRLQKQKELKMVQNVAKLQICVACRMDYEPESNNQFACKDCVPTKGWQARFRRYGITKPIYDEILDAQDGMCPLCLTLITDDSGVIDHNHETGEIRGIVDRGCNMVLSRFEDDGYVSRVARYLGGDKAIAEEKEKSHLSRV